MTQELRERSGPGRALVEAEEDVALVNDFLETERRVRGMAIVEKARQRERDGLKAAPIPRYAPPPPAAAHDETPREMTPSKLLIEQQEDEAVGVRWNRMTPSQRLIEEQEYQERTYIAQPTAEEFLRRPVYANRYLFSCRGDADSVYSNPSTRWRYAIPELGAAGPSTGANDGRYFGQIARISFPGRDTSDSGSANGGAMHASSSTDPLR